MSILKNHSLDIMLRIAYPFNYGSSLNPTAVCDELVTMNSDYVYGLQNYTIYLKNIAKEFDVKHVFVSWEEFQCILGWNRRPLTKRRYFARKTGFVDFLLSNGIDKFDYIPQEGENAKIEILWHKYQDIIYNRIFNIMSDLWEQVNVELRTDDALINKNFYKHDMYFKKRQKTMRNIYWSPFWGNENTATYVSLAKSLFLFRKLLQIATNNSQYSNVFLDQFNFVEETPLAKFDNIYLADYIPFILYSHNILKEYAKGYALWTYKDYEHSYVYNGRFYRNLTGWKYTNTKIERDSDRVIFANIQPFGSLQPLLQDNAFLSLPLQFCISAVVTPQC